MMYALVQLADRRVVEGSHGQAELGPDAGMAPADTIPAQHTACCLDRPNTLVRDMMHTVLVGCTANGENRPKVRAYLVAHPAITLDHFAVTYSSSFSVTWPYDPSHILTSSSNMPNNNDVTTNPIYEEHIRQLKNWTVAEAFRNHFPEIAALIDES